SSNAPPVLLNHERLNFQCLLMERVDHSLTEYRLAVNLVGAHVRRIGINDLLNPFLAQVRNLRQRSFPVPCLGRAAGVSRVKIFVYLCVAHFLRAGGQHNRSVRAGDTAQKLREHGELRDALVSPDQVYRASLKLGVLLVLGYEKRIRYSAAYVRYRDVVYTVVVVLVEVPLTQPNFRDCAGPE